MTQKWEYKCCSLGSHPEVPLNRLGEEGWELICVDPITTSFVLKRPKAPESHGRPIWSGRVPTAEEWDEWVEASGGSEGP